MKKKTKYFSKQKIRSFFLGGEQRVGVIPLVVFSPFFFGGGGAQLVNFYATQIGLEKGLIEDTKKNKTNYLQNIIGGKQSFFKCRH